MNKIASGGFVNREFAKLRDEIRRTRKGGRSVQNERGSREGMTAHPPVSHLYLPLAKPAGSHRCKGVQVIA